MTASDSEAGRRLIIHADMDAFYASVEQLDRPELRGRPVVVGGSPEGRGVVAAASYEARRFGVRSAMPMARALRMCPDAVRVSPRFDRYHELSQIIFGFYRELTPLVETLALDEAYLDVSAAAPLPDEPLRVCLEIKAEVRRRTGLTVSVGAGASKLVAKVASGHGKPDGVVVVPAGDEAAFLGPLPVAVLWGVGPKAVAALEARAIRTVAHLAEAEPAVLRAIFGNRALAVAAMARGEDQRPVEPVRDHKSVGAERTFSRDLGDGPELRAVVERIAAEVGSRLGAQGLDAGTVTLKLRYFDFRTITRQTRLGEPSADAEVLRNVACRLLEQTIQPADRFRLLGITTSNFAPSGAARVTQLRLW
ncbi:MAG: DNA polymerase IV [Dehalococcoidia bacterium]|nr:DNA polymerase IV [Dehalococcoidia bacterium]